MKKLKDLLGSIGLKYYWIAILSLLFAIGLLEEGIVLDVAVPFFLVLFVYTVTITPKRIAKYRRERKNAIEIEQLRKSLEEEEAKLKKEKMAAIRRQRELEYQEKMKYSILVAGTSYRQDVIRKFVLSFARKTGLPKYDNLSNTEIKNYGDTVYEYPVLSEGKVIIEPEPTNKHDANALKVCLTLADEMTYHVGYVAREDQSNVKDWIDSRPNLFFELSGGPYKEVDSSYDSYSNVYTRKSNYYIRVYFAK